MQKNNVKNVSQKKSNKYNEVILNLTADLPLKPFMNKTTLSGRFRIGVRNDFIGKRQTSRVEDPGQKLSGMTVWGSTEMTPNLITGIFCPPCGESTARSGVRGYLNKETSFYNPPTALQATSPTRGADKSGFTLIELLVVVLIIGILAAVALPQYQKAVLKTHYANAKAMALTYAKAAQTYRLANNAWPTDFTQMDVDLPAGSTINYPNEARNICGINGNIYCCLSSQWDGQQDASITCGKTDYQIGYQIQFFDTNQAAVCIAQDSSIAAVSICKEEGSHSVTVTKNLITPNGHIGGHTGYY